MRTGYTFWDLGGAHVIHKNHEKKKEVLAIPHRMHAVLTCSTGCAWVTTHLNQAKKKLGYTRLKIGIHVGYTLLELGIQLDTVITMFGIRSISTNGLGLGPINTIIGHGCHLRGFPVNEKTGRMVAHG